jgi:hypothetical protein
VGFLISEELRMDTHMRVKPCTKVLKDLNIKSPTRRMVFIRRDKGERIWPNADGSKSITRELRDYYRHEASGLVFIRVLHISEATPYHKRWEHVHWTKEGETGQASIGYWLRELKKSRGV